ncbi:MAG: MopE-related protein [Sandaracinaceae bacterium]|nr:MopE-related protein [Sandaracinaceae bacterium]
MRRWLVAASVLLALGCDSAPMPPPGPDGSAGCSSDDDCSDGDFCTGTETCAPEDPAANDLGCVAGTAPCLASQTCDEGANACVSDCDAAPDADGDGVASIECGGADCDDADANRYPGNLEVCDAEAHDEDCDPTTYGDRDADSDGVADAACCNVASSGDRICGTDCDDESSSAHPTAPEVCDTRDNDCDSSVDEGFECTPGETRACSVCGRTGEGTQACDAAVCAWAPCVADEACNACDDDGDGSIDEDFSCVRGSSVACTNACGTESVGTCSSTCDGVEACLTAAEVCNYCDDDGDGTFDDELALATTSDSAAFDCMRDPSLPATYESAIVTLSDATCVPVAGTLQRDAQLLDTAGRSDAGGCRTWCRWASAGSRRPS